MVNTKWAADLIGETKEEVAERVKTMMERYSDHMLGPDPNALMAHAAAAARQASGSPSVDTGGSP